MSGADFASDFYRSMFEWLPLAVVLLDHELRIVTANRAATQLLHLPLTPTPGLPLLSVISHAKLGSLLRNFSDMRSKTVEISVPPRRGHTTVTLKLTATPLVSRQPGVGCGIQESSSPCHEYRLVVLEDVSEKVRLEQQLLDMEKRAGMVQLAAGVAHELANPLTSMTANLMLLRDSFIDESHKSARETVEASIEQVRDMHQILSTLANFTGRRKPSYERSDIQELVRRTLTFIGKDAENRGIQVAVSFAPLPLECEIDVRMIRQVLLNLVKNALEAMPNGGRLDIRVLRRESDGAQPESAIIEIIDSGTGIATVELRKVFRPLFTTKINGMGLGLPFCRQAVEEHGGTIRLTSRKGFGTTATLVIPVSQSGALAKAAGR